MMPSSESTNIRQAEDAKFPFGLVALAVFVLATLLIAFCALVVDSGILFLGGWILFAITPVIAFFGVHHKRYQMLTSLVFGFSMIPAGFALLLMSSSFL